MDIDSLGLIAGFIALAVLVVGGLAMVIRYGGIQGALFGARIKRTVGEVDYGGGLFGSRQLRVHLLDGDNVMRAVGLEILLKVRHSYSTQPIALSKAEAWRLGELLIEAAG